MTREEAITMIKALIGTYITCHGEEDTIAVPLDNIDIEAFDMAIQSLEQEQRWIPTSERLPEEDGEYYVTVYDTEENYQYMDIAELENGIWQYKDYINVLAWMPLPKPYEEKQGNKIGWSSLENVREKVE